MYSRKSKTTTALLALFLGAFGVHKMYLGNWGLGIIYLIFFWTFIPGIIAFIEFIMFIAMSEADFDRKYNALWLKQQELDDAIESHNARHFHSKSEQRRHQAMRNHK